jgi:hypothetical protein
MIRISFMEILISVASIHGMELAKPSEREMDVTPTIYFAAREAAPPVAEARTILEVNISIPAIETAFATSIASGRPKIAAKG